MIPFPEYELSGDRTAFAGSGGQNVEFSIIDKKYDIYHRADRDPARLYHGWDLSAWDPQCGLVHHHLHGDRKPPAASPYHQTAEVHETEFDHAAGAYGPSEEVQGQEGSGYPAEDDAGTAGDL